MEYVRDRNVARELTGTYYLDTIVVNVNVYVVFDPIVAMQYGVRNNLVDCDGGGYRNAS